MQVLIVDDDIATVDVIRDTVNWEKLEVSQVFTAYNIEQAKRILKEKQVDMIISDIEMPQGSGLELLEWFREQQLTGEFLLLTCHESFDYATYAIKYKASEYLLKPFDVDVMEATLRKIIQKIKEERQILENSEYGKWVRKNQRQLKLTFWNQILTGHIAGTEEKIFQEIQNRKLQIDSREVYRLVVSKLGTIEKTKMNPELLLFVMENIHSEILCGNPDNDSVVAMDHKGSYVLVSICKEQEDEKIYHSCERLRKNLKEIFSTEVTICVSSCVVISEFYEAFHRNLRLVDGNVGFYGSVFHEEESANLTRITQTVLEFERLEGFLEEKKKMEFLSYLKAQLSDRNQNKTLNEYVLQQGKEEILQAIYTYLGTKKIQASQLFLDESLSELGEKASQSVLDMIRWANYLVECTFLYEERVKKEYTLGDKIEQYIRENYQENIGRNEIAEQFHLAPEYLSKIYKKEKGVSLKDTIAEYRIREAKRLLERGERVSDVAEAVGFDNFTYFSTSFKKYTGMTPNQYRKK